MLEIPTCPWQVGYSEYVAFKDSTLSRPIRKMKMSVPKIGGSLLLLALTLLVAATFGHASNGARDVIATHISANEIYGYLPRENLSFFIQSGWDVYPGPTANGEIYGKRMTKIEFYLGEKTLLVQAGRGDLYIKGFTTRTGALTPLTAREKGLLKAALEHNSKIKLGEHADIFLSSLNTLSSWPSNMLVFMWHDEDTAMSVVGNDRLATMPRKDFDARNTDAVLLVPLDRQAIEGLTPPVLDMTATDVSEPERALAVRSICFALGHKFRGRYFRCDDILCTDRTYLPYIHFVGGASCFGRCGRGCTGSPQGRRYTRDCFNHDSCVKNLGLTALSCDIMFTFCADDAINAPRCPKQVVR
jgi:hypothetical protein